MKKIITKIKKAYREQRLFSALNSKITPLLKSLKYIFYSPKLNNIKIHCPKYKSNSLEKTEKQLVKRIFHSYKLMKDEQKKVSSLYLPSSLWEKQINQSYLYFLDSYKYDDIEKFHFFLTNFGCWKQYHGVESNMLIRNSMTTFIGRRFLKNEIFNKNLENWKWINGDRKPLSVLTYPTFGNQAGAFVDNVFVGVGSVGNEFYGSMLSELLTNLKRPIVADLGAGYGKFAYFILRDSKKSCFIDFDLPETLCLASYFLMKSWPEKKTLLYGEDDFSNNSILKYDLIFMPANEIEKLGKNSIDLFLNKNSLGEMTDVAAKNYVSKISEASKYFFHMNHDIFPNVYDDNKAGLLGYQYPIPPEKFDLVYRFPEVWHMLQHGGLDYYQDLFVYLYKKKDS